MEDKSFVTLFIDDDPQPIGTFPAPISFDLDTKKLTDGKHVLKVVSKDHRGKEGIKIIPFIVRNGPAIAVEGIRKDEVVDGVLPLMINAYSKGDQKTFMLQGSETPQHSFLDHYSSNYVFCLGGLLSYHLGPNPIVQMKKDIEDIEDIRVFVNEFYASVMADEIIGPIFMKKIPCDWQPHLNKMYAFWNASLFGAAGFRGNPFVKHAPLKIDGSHFERWLELFDVTIDELFKGYIADDAKKRAELMASMFLYRLKQLEGNSDHVIV